jgi:hypothetical protein
MVEGILLGNQYGTIKQYTVSTRETRERRPLLTVETELNGYSKSTNEKGPSLVVGLY